MNKSKHEKENAAESSALLTYGTDLVEAARSGKIDPVIGRDDEVRFVIIAFILISVFLGAMSGLMIDFLEVNLFALAPPPVHHRGLSTPSLPQYY